MTRSVPVAPTPASLRRELFRLYYVTVFFNHVVRGGGRRVKSRIYHGFIVRRNALARHLGPSLADIEALARKNGQIKSKYRLVSATAYEMPASNEADAAKHRAQLKRARVTYSRSSCGRLKKCMTVIAAI